MRVFLNFTDTEAMLKAILRFYKNWALPISMLMGVVLYFVYTSIPFLKSTSHMANRLIGILQPTLIFAMLFITFCKIKPTDLKPCRWHATLLAVQVGAFAAWDTSVCPAAGTAS